MSGFILSVLLSLEVGTLAVLTRGFNRRGAARYQRVARAALQDWALHEKPLPHGERVFTSAYSAGLVHNAAQVAAGARLRHVAFIDIRIGGIIRVFTLCLIPEYRYNVPFFVADIVMIGPRRVVTLELFDPAQIGADHLQRGYRDLRACRTRAAALLPVQDIPASATVRGLVRDLSLSVRTDYRHERELLLTFKDYISTWLNLVRITPEEPPDVQRQIQAGVEQYVESLLQEGGPVVDFERRLMGSHRLERWLTGVVFGVE